MPSGVAWFCVGGGGGEAGDRVVRLGPGANMPEINKGLHRGKISSRAGCDVPRLLEARKLCGEAPYYFV